MEEPIEPPEPPADLPSSVVDEIDQLEPSEIRLAIEYARSRLEHLEAPISTFIEADDDEEILRVEDRNVYTVVVKRRLCEGCEDCPHEPRVYVVTVEPDPEGGRSLHWVDIGALVGESVDPDSSSE